LLDHSDLVRELISLEQHPLPSGRPRIAAPSGGTDDYATALLALVAELAGKDSRSHSGLGQRLEHARVPPTKGLSRFWAHLPLGRKVPLPRRWSGLARSCPRVGEMRPSGRDAGRAMSDDLVIRAQGGDVDAFSALTSGRMSQLYVIARLILRDDDQAADAVQDALFRAWLDLRALRDPAKFDAWLHRLLVRACYRAAGRRRSREVVEIKVRQPVEIATPDTQHLVALRDQLERGFERLSPEQRAVIVLHHYLGLSTNECADVLGIPAGTARSRLDRARAALRAALEADERSPSLAGQGIR
jgi:RNA polymerase sigma-70 factor, ECF subfamily